MSTGGRTTLAIASMAVHWLFSVGVERAGAQVAEGREFEILDGRAGVQDVHINHNIATTVAFPDPINLVTGYGLVDDGQSAAGFGSTPDVSVVHFQHVSADTLVLRLLRQGREPCFLTVRCRDQFYLLRCLPAEEAHMALLVSKDGPPGGGREVTPDKVVENRIAYHPVGLIGILSRAKQRKFLEQVNPELFEGWQERNRLNLVSKIVDGEVVVREIQRWPERDAIVLRARLRNLSNRERAYDPQDIFVRVGDRVYPVQLSDASGRIAAGADEPIDLVIVGNAAGGREHLSIDNDFRVELTLLSPDSLTAADAAAASAATADLFPSATNLPSTGGKNPSDR